MDASADARRTRLLTATNDLPRRDKPAPEQQSKHAQQASRTAADTLVGEPALFQTLDEELAALLAIDLGKPGSALAQVRPNTGGLIRNDGPAPTVFTSATSDVGPGGSSSTPEGLFGKEGPDEQTLLFQASAADAGRTTRGQGSPPAPPAASPPPSSTIQPRPRTSGPSRPARPRGSLAFGTSMASGVDGNADSCDTEWAAYGEASVVGNTVTLGVADRPETGDTQPSDVHGASLLLPPAEEYTITFDVDLFTWDSYNEDMGKGTGTGFWDSFSVSVTSEPYPYLAWTDPVSLPFVWGGRVYGDGERDNRTGTFSITVPGDPGGPNYLNVVLDTFSQPLADAAHPSWGTVSITAGIPAGDIGVQSVVFLRADGARAGSLSSDNPDGDPGPAFGGGYRFFPDAASYETRNQPRNMVLVKADTIGIPPGVPVYFRSFDVDDPSANATIDPNDQRTGAEPVNTGKDNRGTVAGADLSEPGLAAEGAGYRGRLRPVGGDFAEEGAIVAANTDADGDAYVELATSFNPGDNFRVVASCSRPAVERLNDTTSVPTTGPVNVFAGAATDQLSVWRRFHIEQDRMKAIPWGSKLTGNITDATEPDATTRESVVTIEQPIPAADLEKYVGATLYDNRGVPNVVIKIDPDDTRKLTVYVHQFKPENGAFTIYKGDAVEGKIKSVEDLQGGLFKVVVEPGIQALPGQFSGGLLRVAGTNYHVIGNQAGTTDVELQIIASQAPGAVNDPMILYDDDYSETGDRLGTWVQAQVTASSGPDAGEVELTINRNDISNERFLGGKVLHYGTAQVYDFLSVTDNKLRVRATAALPTNQNVAIWVPIYSTVPTVLTDPTSDANMYDMLQATTTRANNRYADAYLQPVLTSLNAYSQAEVTPANHVVHQTNRGHDAVFDRYRGPDPRPTDPPYETDFFWAVYVSTGFEAHFRNSNDGAATGEMSVRGTTHGQGTLSGVWLETIRDIVATTYALNQSPQISEATSLARTTVHEIGHQFLDPGHSDPPNPPNIMMGNTSTPTDTQFYFLPGHIVSMRQRIKSPPSV